MMKQTVIAALATLVALVSPAPEAGAWTQRSGDAQNTGNAGDQPGLTPETVRDLQVTRTLATQSYVTATPVVAEGLLIVGDWAGLIHVFDIDADYKLLLRIDTGSGGTPNTGVQGELSNYHGVQATPTVGTVTLPGGGEELRAYVGANSAANTLWCINLSKVLADRATLEEYEGDAYSCEGPTDGDGSPPWPKRLTAPGSNNGTLNGSPMFSARQPIEVDGETVVRDVIYTPTTGLDCSNGEMWAIDAYTGELYWSFDPVVNGNSQGGVIWTTPAMNEGRTLVYVTTGNCVTKPQVGEKAESLVALDAATGAVEWWHQRRLVDTADLDIGNGPLVADVEGEDGCNVVVSPDKDGCIYGFSQEEDIPEVGDIGYDPLRAGQQRVLYRKCFVPGSLNGGFNASNMAIDGRYAAQAVSGYPAGFVGGDDSNAFAIDVCTGKVKWASSDVGNARIDGAVASGMLFQPNAWRMLLGHVGRSEPTAEMQVVRMDSGNERFPEVLATVTLPAQPSLGGGGAAIADDRIYVPMLTGVAVVEVVEDSNASAPKSYGNNIFAGPYPHPIAPGLGSLPAVNPDDPYPLLVDNTVGNQAP